MKTIAIAAVMGGLLLAGAAAPAAEQPANFQALFCPECWDYLWGPGVVDAKGNCSVCGKYPVEMEVAPMAWWWCAREKKWAKTPCALNWMKRCDTREESLAAVVRPMSDVFEAWYCPSHRGFYVYRIPILSQWVCRTCAKPAVKVDAVERAWYWCETDGLWATKPCLSNPVKKCCVRRDGVLLIKAEPGPIAK